MEKKSVNIRLDDDEWSKVQSICAKYAKATASDVLRAALRLYEPNLKSLASVVRLHGAAAYAPEKRVAAGRKGGVAKAANRRGERENERCDDIA